jgi:23S rRNA A2030 N6-methylase RlmJ
MDALYEGLGDSVTREELEEEVEAYIPAIQSPLTEEQFQYYHGEDVLSLYHWLQNECERQGWFLFSLLTYQDMLELAFRTSPKDKPPC